MLLNGGELLNHEGNSETEVTIELKKKGIYPFELLSLHQDEEDEVKLTFEAPGYTKQRLPRELFAREKTAVITTPLLTPELSTVPESRMKTVRLKDTGRIFSIHLPKNFDQESDFKLPTVIVLADHKLRPEYFSEMTGFNTKADQEGFITVYPETKSLHTADSMEYETEQLEFFGSLLEKLESDYHADPNRIYLTGFAEGGSLAHLLGARLPRFAAVGSVSGTAGFGSVHSVRSLPVIHIHGTRDRITPERGGFGSTGDYEYTSVDEMLRMWIIHNRSGIIPVVEDLPNPKKEGCRMKQFLYPAENPGAAETIYIQIENGGHTWPGANNSPKAWGKVCRDVKGCDLLWAFFKRHQLR